jgi:hypothetical protein
MYLVPAAFKGASFQHHPRIRFDTLEAAVAAIVAADPICLHKNGMASAPPVNPMLGRPLAQNFGTSIVFEC